eukprot:705457-Pleurochrysis_carterae.AAC.1
MLGARAPRPRAERREEPLDAERVGEVVAEWHGAEGRLHQPRVAVDVLEPLDNLPGVGHGGGERDDARLVRREDARLLPHGAARRVVHVVELVEHYHAHTRERRLRLGLGV